MPQYGSRTITRINRRIVAGIILSTATLTQLVALPTPIWLFSLIISGLNAFMLIRLLTGRGISILELLALIVIGSAAQQLFGDHDVFQSVILFLIDATMVFGLGRLFADVLIPNLPVDATATTQHESP